MTSQRLASIFVPLCLVVVLTAVKCVEGEDDLYHVLGVSNSASSREIRSAYKRLAKKWYGFFYLKLIDTVIMKQAWVNDLGQLELYIYCFTLNTFTV